MSCIKFTQLVRMDVQKGEKLEINLLPMFFTVTAF